ncbi:MAG: glutamine amidotransferase, partial [Pseudomonadota bacterium]
MGKFLVLQLRPETEASDDEFDAFLSRGGLDAAETHRIRLDEVRLPADLRLEDYVGVIIGGGPGCVSDPVETKDPLEARMEEDCLALMPEIVARDMPFMGCCAGIGLLAHHLGAEVSKRQYSEPVGPVECRFTPAAADDPLMQDLDVSGPFTA